MEQFQLPQFHFSHNTSQHERILHLSCFRFNVHYHQLLMATCEVNHIHTALSYHQSKSRENLAPNWFPYIASARIISNCSNVHLGDNYLKAIFLYVLNAPRFILLLGVVQQKIILYFVYLISKHRSAIYDTQLQAFQALVCKIHLKSTQTRCSVVKADVYWLKLQIIQACNITHKALACRVRALTLA